MIKNPIKNKRDYQNLKTIIDSLKKSDYFYNKKFKKEMLNFQITINIFKNNFRALKILLRLTFNNDLISKMLMI